MNLSSTVLDCLVDCSKELDEAKLAKILEQISHSIKTTTEKASWNVGPEHSRLAQAVMVVLAESARLDLSPIDFQMGFEETDLAGFVQKGLTQLYSQTKPVLRRNLLKADGVLSSSSVAMDQLAGDQRRLVNVEWCLDVLPTLTGTDRSLTGSTSPLLFTVQLTFADGADRLSTTRFCCTLEEFEDLVLRLRLCCQSMQRVAADV